MKLGLVTYNLAKDFTLPELLELCRDCEIEGVELRTTHAHGVEPGLSPAARREVRERFAASGVTLWGLGSTCEFHSPDPAVVAENVRTCAGFAQLAHDTGARGVKVRPNGLPSEVPEEKTLEQIGRAVAECARQAGELGVEIWVEVHGAATQEPLRMKRIMEHAAHPNAGLTWNSNPTDLKGGSIRESFELLKPWIRSCHINELPDRRYPWRELFSLLDGAGYDRFTLCECQESSDPHRVLRYYAALWRAMTAREP
jgi:sugar phosphate isomerase/epimerase